MKKRFAALGLATMLVGTLLTGCGSSTGSTETSKTSKDSKKEAAGSVYYLNFIFPIDIPEPWSLKDVHPPVLSTPDIASCAAL